MNPIQTIQIDTREKIPLIFPPSVTIKHKGKRKVYPLRTEKVEMYAGDYRLKEFPNLGGCERKMGNSELHNNLLTKDKKRFHKAYQKLLDEYSFPFLLIEQSPLEFLGKWPRRPSYVGEYDTFDSLMRLQISSPVPILWAGTQATSTRRKVGGLVARTLILAALEAG